MMNFVCEKDCAGRSPTCHCTCEKYLAAQAKHKAELDQINKQKMLAGGITEQEKHLYNKIRRRKGK